MTEIHNAGSILTKSNNVEYEIFSRGAGVVLLNKIFPVGTRISFDGGGEIELKSYTAIRKKFSSKIKIRVPKQTFVASGETINEDVNLKFLVFQDESNLMDILSRARQDISEQLTITVGTMTIQNMNFRDVLIQAQSSSSSVSETYNLELGQSLSKFTQHYLTSKSISLFRTDSIYLPYSFRYLRLYPNVNAQAGIFDIIMR